MRRSHVARVWIDPESDALAGGPWFRVVWGVPVLLAALFAGCFTWLSLARHAAFQSHAFDLGNMDQAVWNTLQGRFLGFTDMAAGGNVYTSRLAIHVEPLLVALAPLYWLHSGPETLLVVQALVVAAGAIPAYLLAREAIGSTVLALVFPAAFLLHPSIQNAVLDDFHAVTLSACFLMWALYFAWRGTAPGFVAFAILAAATKEEVGLLAAALGLLFLARQRWYVGAMSIVCGVGWFLFCELVIIPSANPAGHSPYLGRYAYLGHGLGGAVTGALRHPDLMWHTLTSAGRKAYLIDLLHPLGYVPVAGIGVFLLAAPVLLINMLSADDRMYSGFYQYSAEVVPFAVGGAAIGIGLVRRVARKSGIGLRFAVPVLCLLVLTASAIDSWKFGFSPIARGYIVPSPGAHQALEASLLRLVPSGVPVAAADEIEPHLSDRRWIYLLPTVHPGNGPPAQFMVLDASIPSLPVDPRMLHRTAVTALRNGYGLVAAQDGILVLARHTRGKALPPGFFSFAYHRGAGVTPANARWGKLALTGFVIHPRDGLVNRSRPAVAVETYWRARARLSRGLRIAFYLSPVYTGAHPTFSSAWTVESDSPTWDWLPLTSWPSGKTVSADSLPMLPAPYVTGKVDVAVGVSGGGSVSASGLARLSPTLVRLGTVSVEG